MPIPFEATDGGDTERVGAQGGHDLLTLPQGEAGDCPLVEPTSNELLPIGRFATLSRLSLKALRLYDAHGVLRPVRVDPESGYRLYSPDQLGEARRVLLLRRIGLSLEAIRRAGDATVALAESGVREARRRAEEAERALNELRRLHEEPPMDFPVTLKTLPAFDALLWSGRTTIADLETTIATRCAQISEAAGGDADPASRPFLVFVGPVDENSDGPIDVVFPLTHPIAPPEGLAVRRYAEVEAATTAAHGDQADFPAILGAYDAVYCWANGQGRPPSEPPREVRLDDEGSAFEIQLPLA